MSPRSLGSRADVLSATAAHPYARFATAADPGAHGLADGATVLWVNGSPFGPLGHSLGPLGAITGLIAASGDLLDGIRWLNLPRHADAERPAGFSLNDAWDLRWCLALPAEQVGEERVVELDDGDTDEINELLDAAMPETVVRPGTTLVRRFWGVRSGGRLVACGADRSSPFEHEHGMAVGVVGAIAVQPEHRRRGLGAAITAGVTRRLARHYPLVVLGQAAANETATRLYPRLGYTGVQHFTSVRAHDAARSA